MLRILKYLAILVVLGLLALGGYAVLGDYAPQLQEIDQPVTLTPE